ncbi:hypothetical protein BDW66DRAFT_167017 [Aspergillus desertorum]
MSTITLYRGWIDPNRYVWSPFVVKLEARLRIAGVPYRTASGSTSNQSSAPARIGDSTLIIKHLIERGVLRDLNAGLSRPERASDLAVRALLEDKAYFYNTRERWIENYYTMRDHVLSSVPYPVRIVVGLLIYRSTVKTLHGQGTGRYSADEIQSLHEETWGAVNDLLVASKSKAQNRDGPFWVLGGEKPTEADATVFGFVVSALICEAGPKTKELVMALPVMREYARRIHDAYFPDYEWIE